MEIKDLTDDQLKLDFCASRVISFDKTLPCDYYDKTYYQTNEDLLDTYLDVDFYDKDVLTVLGSSDQVLTARFLDARRVDAFDKNILTKYYFYLRLWTIKYMNKLYPNVYDNRFLKELLARVNPETKEEKEAYRFYLLHAKKNTTMSKLFYDIEAQPHGRTLYTEAGELTDCLDPNIDFYQLDLFKREEHPKKYDIIIISNILDWARHDREKLQNAAFNLNRYINKEGYILGSNLIQRSREEKEQEQSIMGEFFTLEEEKEKSYVYKKK